ncbi:hypothetical protein LZ017_05945 [Pelomonas sp. CA6]|uniref:hypothetical protein n=1 Tax=Pelomonas sp. CA6 TaxID=2907999 RepID=UPI001F4A2CCD|nr:hypothetical protein [Pelomonas sp. CA6]MCH7342921.1 hypothetical protein [Pelomonas sp. CA6]
MLNRSAAADAKEAAEAAIKKFNGFQAEVLEASTSLFELRQQVGEALIGRAEAFVNEIADHPKEFDKTFAEFHVEAAKFQDIQDLIGKQHRDAAIESGSAAGVGIAAGAATAFVGPTAAMAVATTFGTASTGAAISGLSGAAATNAALAWLGGGALATGGGGMAAGNALLALAGPIGWTAAGVCAAGGLVYFYYKNQQTIESANEARLSVERATNQILEARELVSQLLEQTTLHASGVRQLLNRLEGMSLPASYWDFSTEQLEAIGALVNHVHSLSVLLNTTVEGRAKAAESGDATEAAQAEEEGAPTAVEPHATLALEAPSSDLPNFIMVGGAAPRSSDIDDALKTLAADVARGAEGQGWFSRFVGTFR